METQLLLSAFNIFLRCISTLVKIITYPNLNQMRNNNQGDKSLAIIGMIIIALLALLAFFVVVIKL